ncbi:hypothetical protein V866_007944 [Kwoniella sp. B9012]
MSPTTLMAFKTLLLQHHPAARSMLLSIESRQPDQGFKWLVWLQSEDEAPHGPYDDCLGPKIDGPADLYPSGTVDEGAAVSGLEWLFSNDAVGIDMNLWTQFLAKGNHTGDMNELESLGSSEIDNPNPLNDVWEA